MSTIAFLIIGNEILSGRTAEKNLRTLAALLSARGLHLSEARVVRDETEAIVDAINTLRAKYDYVFTSGGIGPTHDDITAAAVARAFGAPLEENADAVAKLRAFYDGQQMEFTAARRRMTLMPAGAEIVVSDFPGAPAFVVGNVIVCAGVPEIFSLMATAAAARLPTAPRRYSLSARVFGGESVFSDALAQIAAESARLEIGSYPKREYCEVIFSGADEGEVAAALRRFVDYLTAAKMGYEC